MTRGAFTTRESERQISDNVFPFLRFRRPSDQFDILDILPNRAAKLMAEDKSDKRPPLTLPGFGKGFEPDVLSEYYPSEFIRPSQKVMVRQFFGAIFDCRQDVDPTATKLVGNRPRNMNIHVQGNGHLHQPLGSHTDHELRGRGMSYCRFNLL